jgi:hypothetical protein
MRPAQTRWRRRRERTRRAAGGPRYRAPQAEPERRRPGRAATTVAGYVVARRGIQQRRPAGRPLLLLAVHSPTYVNYTLADPASC